MNEFQTNKYKIVRNAISKELSDFITQYALFDEMQDFQSEGMVNPNGQPQVPAAHFKYADPAMESLLLQLHPIMEEHTGLSLYPTYSYFRVYRNGDDLKPHTDRPACEISTTLCFNYGYDDTKYQWPIFMDGKEVKLNSRDMVIYRGSELRHWREEFLYPEDTWQVQGFFHYVDANGPNASHKWDMTKRDGIGQPVNKNKHLKIDTKPHKPYIHWL